MTQAEVFFVAGTDTEVGKTFATCALMHRARAEGKRVLAMKPVAAGADQVDGRRINEDAATLTSACSFDPGIELLNPYCFSEPVAPHIAAAHEEVVIEPKRILMARDRLARQADLLLIEGVGGFRVPLGPSYDTADLAAELAAPVLLVVGLRLGCINHALLTADAVAARGLRLAGWIGNCIDPAMARRDENLAALQELLAAPLLGVLPFSTERDPSAHAAGLQLPLFHPPTADAVLVLDSATELSPIHHGRVVITASHGGRASAHHALAARPALVFFNDAGVGKDAAGVSSLVELEQAGIAAACYSHESARIGDAWDAFGNGRVSSANALARDIGVRVGDPVVAAATLARKAVDKT